MSQRQDLGKATTRQQHRNSRESCPVTHAQGTGNTECSVLVWGNCVHVWSPNGMEQPRVVQRKHSVNVLLVGSIFCGCDVHATFSEPVGAWDAVDEACGKQLERGSAEQDPGTSSR
ncbi:hypothetical protein IscW_ISCW015930 [Ixodes scapularis]|uniref:Uncharacterized protein n=1 Tax=Ixodes scapularis TaxID=6945 RepID=B7P2M2_IXOSC|nr:hypothetical protein IscW_ISCW015930 [Ixodes scapularis]|eukprot:XP_002402577.1 hypothetical protein IscW_ISCW015930 [Ixodes scapularis]